MADMWNSPPNTRTGMPKLPRISKEDAKRLSEAAAEQIAKEQAPYLRPRRYPGCP